MSAEGSLCASTVCSPERRHKHIDLEHAIMLDGEELCKSNETAAGILGLTERAG